MGMRIFPLAIAGLVAASVTLADACARNRDGEAQVAPMPPGRLADALLALAADADVNIAFDAALIGDRHTQGLAASAPLRGALDELLRGSGLTYTVSQSGDVSIAAAPRRLAPLSTPPPRDVAPEETILVLGYRDGLDRAQQTARSYDGLVTIVTADAIGKLADANIADALNRLPSVYRISDQGEGRYLSLRGISQELDTVTLNGVAIASSDTDGRSGRAAPLDVLSASALSSVEIHSVLTPDRDANAIGGLIDVRTPSAHEFAERVANVTIETGAADFGQGRDIYAARGAYSALFGPNNAFGVYIGGEYWVREYLSHFYDVAEVARSADGVEGLFPDRILWGASAGRRERSSLTASLDWRGANGSAAWLNLFATDYNDEEVRPEFLLYRRGALSAPSADAFSWRGLRVRTETRTERQERPVRQYVLGGRWTLSEAWTLQAIVNRTDAQERNPYVTYYETSGDIDPPHSMAEDIARFSLSDGLAFPDGDLTAPNGMSVFDGAFQHLFRIRRITSDVREEIETQQLDLRREGSFAERPLSLQFGVKRLERLKTVDDADHRYNFIGAETLANSAIAGALGDYGWDESYAIVPGLDLPFADPAGLEALFAARPDLFVYDAVSSRWNSVEDDYRIRETILAGYAMGVIEVTPALRLTVGARVEHTDVEASANAFVSSMTATGFEPGEAPLAQLPFAQGDILPTLGGRDYTNVSPAVLLKWDRGEAWVLRASLTHTFARPDYVELAPISTLSIAATRDPESGLAVLSAVNEIGNPSLRPIESENWDVSVQYHLPGDTGWLALAGFHKSLDGVLFNTADTETNVVFAGARFDRFTALTTENVGRGHVSGLEVSARYEFRAAPAPFDGFGVLASAAFIRSRLESPAVAQARPLEDQADLVYSTQLYYERGGFQARLAYSYQGAAPRGDQWTAPTANNARAPWSRLDAKLVVDLSDAWRASLAGSNLTNTPYRTDRSTTPYLAGSGPGYETYGREFRLGLTRRW